MTAILTNNGDGTFTLAFEYTAASQKISDTAGDAAKALYDRNAHVPVDGNGDPIPWATLTNQQKADMLDLYIRSIILNLARDKYSDDAALTARQQAAMDVITRHDLG